MWRRVLLHSHQPQLSNASPPSSGVELGGQSRSQSSAQPPAAALQSCCSKFLECHLEIILNRNLRSNFFFLGRMIMQKLHHQYATKLMILSWLPKSEVQRACNTNPLCETEALVPCATTMDVHQLHTRRSRSISLKHAHSCANPVLHDGIKVTIHLPDH